LCICIEPSWRKPDTWSWVVGRAREDRARYCVPVNDAAMPTAPNAWAKAIKTRDNIRRDQCKTKLCTVDRSLTAGPVITIQTMLDENEGTLEQYIRFDDTHQRYITFLQQRWWCWQPISPSTLTTNHRSRLVPFRWCQLPRWLPMPERTLLDREISLHRCLESSWRASSLGYRQLARPYTAGTSHDVLMTSGEVVSQAGSSQAMASTVALCALSTS
jgi:hypothetical protein